MPVVQANINCLAIDGKILQSGLTAAGTLNSGHFPARVLHGCEL
jgi:hypothetical protein